MRVVPALVLLAATATAHGAPAQTDPRAQSGAAPQTGAPVAAVLASTPAVARAELARRTSALADGAAARRRTAAHAIEDAGPDAVMAIVEHLAELRRARPDPADDAVGATIRATRRELRAAGRPTADVGDAAAPKPGPDVTSGLVDALADAPPGPAITAALTAAAYALALRQAGTTPAVRGLILLAGDHGGALRPEITHAVHALGDRAVPALLEARALPFPDLRAWAAAQLEAMNKRIPADAVQMRDNDVLGDVLRAFATARDMDALPVVLSFVNSDRAQVRLAAREAIARYGVDARGPLREAFANLTGKPPDERWNHEDLARQLFAAYDRYRLQEVYAVVDEGLARLREGKLAEAVAAFDRALAQQPLLERRSELVPAYVLHAQRLEDSDPAAALATYRKAAYLDPESHRRPQIEGAIAALEAQALEARGIADPDAYRRALALDPTNPKARDALARLESAADHRAERVRRTLATAIVLALFAVGAILFGRRPRSGLHA